MMLANHQLSDDIVSMQTTVRQFIRRFAHFRRQAEAGRVLELKDGKGIRYKFEKQKRRSFIGAAKDLCNKGAKPLTAEPIPASEFKGSY